MQNVATLKAPVQAAPRPRLVAWLPAPVAIQAAAPARPADPDERLSPGLEPLNF